MSLLKFLTTHVSLQGPGGFALDGPLLFVIPMLLACAWAVIASTLWLYRDAEARGKNGFLVIAFVFLTGWPLSFLWWHLLRPQAASRAQAGSV